MGIVAVEIGRSYAPDHRRHRQEAPKRISGDAGGVLVFFRRIAVAWRGWGLSFLVPGIALWVGGLKRQETCGWFLTTRVFWHFLCLWRE